MSDVKSNGLQEMCCGFLWWQFVEAGIDELVNFCPHCGQPVERWEE